MVNKQLESFQVNGPLSPSVESVLTPEAKAFLTKLHKNFNSRRKELLSSRDERQKQLDQGKLPTFLAETKRLREDKTWRVAETPKDLQKRWVEITGPTERKMLINALNSGANVFMADFEDALSPTWENVIDGQINLSEAIDGSISLTTPEGKSYKLKENPAVLMVRPRGWHLEEKHVTVDGEPMSASLFDFGLYFFRNAKKLIKNGSGPYFYLPKMENHREARLWNDVFVFAQKELGIPTGTIRATVLLETILAAFEMEEILYELKEHSAGLNAGRWDYMFSAIKKFNKQEGFVFPDRVQITMTVPFMRAYTELLVKTCHKRGAHAMGGMAAFIPSRKDKEINDAAIKKVTEDKIRETQDGFDGTWVAHPDLVPIAMDVFTKYLKDKPHQKDRLKEAVDVQANQLIDFHVPGGKITEAGLRLNISVALQYLESWLRGQGAVAINNLMEDAATAEISRAQLWQWIRQPNGLLNDGTKIDLPLVRQIANEELDKIKKSMGEETFRKHKFKEAHEILDKLISDVNFDSFLTLLAYNYLK